MVDVNFNEYKELETVEFNVDRDIRAVNSKLPVYRESDGELFHETREPKIPPNNPADIFHMMSSGESFCRFELLAMKFYRTTQLWWVVPDTNDIIDLFDWYGAGQTVRIPHLHGLLGSILI